MNAFIGVLSLSDLYQPRARLVGSSIQGLFHNFMSLKKRNLRTYVAWVNVLMKSSNITQFLCFLFKFEKRIRITISLDFKYALTKTLKDDILDILDILITNCVLFIFLSVASNDAYLFWAIVRKNEELQNVKF